MIGFALRYPLMGNLWQYVLLASLRPDTGQSMAGMTNGREPRY